MTQTLTPRQRCFIGALLAAKTVRQSAELAGVCERTAYRWLRSEVVRAELSQRQDAALQQATGQLVEAMAEAIAVLREIMADGGAQSSARVAAARAVLEASLRCAELLDLARRVAALEETAPLVINVKRWEGGDAETTP